METEMSIGRLATLCGCKVQTIRYYEEVGILPPARRSGGNQRLYTPTHGERLLFIRHCREFGFTIEQIREMLLLGGDGERSCEEIDRIARERLEEVKQKILRLQGLQAELERIITGCQGGRVITCRILSSLADHGQCLHPRHGVMDPEEGVGN
ncbi:MAG: helix-turn-helix domain-containing protein [Magnetococcales bacterium]|nr:helix-turn-helix domain-containing protein [Magnetococcales bacterium]